MSYKIDLISLDNDIFSVQSVLRENYSNATKNMQKIVDILVSEGWIDHFFIKIIPETEIIAERCNEVLSSLINNVNIISRLFNKQGLFLPPEYNELSNINVVRTANLKLNNEFRNIVNNNFSKCETRINDFYKILEDAKLIKRKEYRQIDIVGDSITYGMGASNPSKDYVSVLEKEIKIPIKNDGVSSATIQNGSNNDQISFINRVKKIDFSKSDIVIVFGGTNDFAQSLPVGKSTDATDKSLIGALKTVINQIKKSNPNALVLIIPPMWRARINDSSKFVDINTVPNSTGVLFKEYFNAVVKIAKDYKIPYLDLFNNSEINQKNYKDYLADGLHPNDKGHRWLANKVHNFILNNVETPNNLK